MIRCLPWIADGKMIGKKEIVKRRPNLNWVYHGLAVFIERLESVVLKTGLSNEIGRC